MTDLKDGQLGSALDELEDTYRRLQAIETEMRGFFEHMPDLALIVGPKGRILRANEQCRRLLGWDVDELLGLRFSILSHPDSSRDVEHRLNIARQPTDPDHTRCVEIRVPWRTPDGDWRGVTWRLRHMPDVGCTLAIGRVDGAAG